MVVGPLLDANDAADAPRRPDGAPRHCRRRQDGRLGRTDSAHPVLARANANTPMRPTRSNLSERAGAIETRDAFVTSKIRFDLRPLLRYLDSEVHTTFWVCT